MQEINFVEEINLFYDDDFDISTPGERMRYRNNQGHDFRREQSFKENYSFNDRSEVIISDEFGCTHAPNVMTDNFKYIEENRRSIYPVNDRMSIENHYNVHENPTLAIAIKKDIAKIKTLENILSIKTYHENLNLTLLIQKKKYSDISLDKLKEVSVSYLRFTQSPFNQTLRDWKNTKLKKSNDKAIELMFDLIAVFQSKVKKTF